MTESFDLLLLPTLACLVLIGIHVYFGSHVIRRGVIFVDLSLAQVAAFGTTIGWLIGFGHESYGSYFFSLGFALVGAALFALARGRHETEVPQEAIIGIVYAVATAATVLAVARQPEGAEHIKALLVGSVLTVTPEAVGRTAAVYAVIGVLHWLWRRPLWAVTTDAVGARARGLSIRLWDFAFYGTFAFVVTSSVTIVGVLLVFTFLVVPGVAAIRVVSGVRRRLIFGWTFGLIVCIAGMMVSFVGDLPPGATIVATFGLGFVLVYLLSGFRRRAQPATGALDHEVPSDQSAA